MCFNKAWFFFLFLFLFLGSCSLIYLLSLLEQQIRKLNMAKYHNVCFMSLCEKQKQKKVLFLFFIFFLFLLHGSVTVASLLYWGGDMW